MVEAYSNRAGIAQDTQECCLRVQRSIGDSVCGGTTSSAANNTSLMAFHHKRVYVPAKAHTFATGLALEPQSLDRLVDELSAGVV